MTNAQKYIIAVGGDINKTEYDECYGAKGCGKCLQKWLNEEAKN